MVVLSRCVQLNDRFFTSCLIWGSGRRVLQPRWYIGPQSTKQHRFVLFPFRSPLLRESLVDFFSSGYLDVSVLPLTFRYADITAQPVISFLIRGPPAKLVRQLTEAYRSLTAPFFGFWLQGIHRKLLLSWPTLRPNYYLTINAASGQVLYRHI